MTPPSEPVARVRLQDRLANAVLVAADTIPESVLDRHRLLLVDSVGISLAATRLSPAASATAAAATVGAGTGRCRLWDGSTGSPATAALANAAFAHALDFDDTHDRARMHTTTVTLPAALAVGELVDASMSEVLRATVIGSELMCRLGLAAAPTATNPAGLWFMAQLTGYFGAAVTAALVLGIDRPGIASAIGFAYAQAAGGKQAAVATGSDERSIYPAFAAAGGVTAALLARQGLRGPSGALDGPTGLWRAYLGSPLTDEIADRITDLGHEPWAVDDIDVKPWPACRLSHPYIDAALSIGPIDAPIERITLAVNASGLRLCEPAAGRRRPSTLPDAGFSLPYLTALALARGRVTLSDFTADLLTDRRVHELADLVQVQQSLPDEPGNPVAEVTVLAGGASRTGTGRPYPALVGAGVLAKSEACLRTAFPALDPAPVMNALDRAGRDPSLPCRSLMQEIAVWTSGG